MSVSEMRRQAGERARARVRAEREAERMGFVPGARVKTREAEPELGVYLHFVIESIDALAWTARVRRASDGGRVRDEISLAALEVA